jgi:AraC family L-rhamnose operon regulatory protein RhaS
MNCVDHFGLWLPSKRWLHLAPHTNPGLEIVLVTKGEFTWQVDGRAEAIRPNTVFYTLPWQVHGSSEKRHPGTELYFVIIKPSPAGRLNQKQFSPHPELGFTEGESRWVEHALTTSRHHAFPASPAMRTLLPMICCELQHRHAGQAAYVTGLLRAAVVELTLTVLHSPPRHTPRADAANAVRQLLPVLEREYHAHWTLDAMAQRCGLKRSQFAVHFTRLTGDTPITYLNRLRIQRADQLLSAADQSVTDIAFACGFQSSQYFATVYRQFTGQSPSTRWPAREHRNLPGPEPTGPKPNAGRVWQGKQKER